MLALGSIPWTTNPHNVTDVMELITGEKIGPFGGNSEERAFG